LKKASRDECFKTRPQYTITEDGLSINEQKTTDRTGDGKRISRFSRSSIISAQKKKKIKITYLKGNCKPVETKTCFLDPGMLHPETKRKARRTSCLEVKDTSDIDMQDLCYQQTLPDWDFRLVIFNNFNGDQDL
jgi:hypothetical protein